MDNKNNNAIDDMELESVNGGMGVWDKGSKVDDTILVKCDKCGMKKTMLRSELASPKKSKCSCGGRFNEVR